VSGADVGSDAQIAEIASHLRTVIWQLLRRYRRDRTLPTSQTTALIWIDRDGPLTTSRLASLEHVRPQSMAHTVRQLQDAGFIKRKPDPGDGRKVLLDLTPVGRATLAELRAEGESWVSDALAAGFTADERRELARGIELLARLASE
jgi:DNA-binding MarR family transcriptional regulator